MNALHLARTSLEDGLAVRLFLMKDAVDLARPASRPEGAEFDLADMVGGLLAKGAALRLCQICLNRCGIGYGDILAGAEVGGMKDLVDWIKTSDRRRSF